MGWSEYVRWAQEKQIEYERGSITKQHELEWLESELKTMSQNERNFFHVEVFNNIIDRLKSFHKQSSPKIDWKSLLDCQPPDKPTPSHEHEIKAREILRNYQAGFWERLTGQASKEQTRLERACKEAREIDKEIYVNQIKKFRRQTAGWKECKEFAKRVLAGDENAYVEVIQELNAFDEIHEVGSEIKWKVIHHNLIDVVIDVHGKEIVPREEKSILPNGRMRVRQMSQEKFNEIYQDCVCSACMRIVREVFSILPIEMAIVTAVDDLENPQTGHTEEFPILSVIIPIHTLEDLNLDAIDPSDSMQNFVHHMNFDRTKGFQPVHQIQPEELSII